MSKLFNRNAAMKVLTRTSVVFDAAGSYFKFCTRVCETVAKVTSNEQLKGSICDSLEAICKVAEDRAMGLYHIYGDQYSEDIQNIMNDYQEYDQKEKAMQSLSNDSDNLFEFKIKDEDDLQ